MKKIVLIVFGTLYFTIGIYNACYSQISDSLITISAGYGMFEYFYLAEEADHEYGYFYTNLSIEQNYELQGPPEVFYLKIENLKKKWYLDKYILVKDKKQNSVYVSHNIALSVRELTNQLTFSGLGYTNDTSVYEASRTRIAFSYIKRTNYTLLNTERFRVYGGYGIGVRITIFINYKDNAYNYDDDDDVAKVFMPLAFEATLGCRYYLTKNVGFYFETGFAKTAIQAGVCMSW